MGFYMERGVSVVFGIIMHSQLLEVEVEFRDIYLPNSLSIQVLATLHV